MDDFFKKSKKNATVYRDTLERIICKYSNVHENGTEVNLENMPTHEVAKHMASSELEMLKLNVSKSDADLSLEDISEIQRPQDTTADFGMDLSFRPDDSINDPSDASSANGTAVTAYSKDPEEDIIYVSSTQLSETQSSLPGTLEKQDEELESSLCSHNSSLPELYPKMLSQIRAAQRRQNMSDMAVGLLRRYNKHRWFSKNQQNRTFDRSQTPALRKRSVLNCSKPSVFRTSRTTTLNQSNLGSAANLSASPSRTTVNLQECPAERLSPVKKSDSSHRPPPRPVLVLDMSHAYFSPASSPPSTAAYSSIEESPMNQTFTVSMHSYPTQSTHVFSPARSDRPSIARGFTSPSQRNGLSTILRQRVFSAGRSEESNSTYSGLEASVDTAARSPYRARQLSLDGQWVVSHHTNMHRSPKMATARSHESNVSTVPRSSPSSLRKSHLSPRKLYLLNSHSPSQIKPDVSRSSRQENSLQKPTRWRSCSLDLSSPSVGLKQHSKQVDEDFKELYHKFVCQAKSCPSCLCDRLSVSTRSPSHLSLSALALSPHHSIMRKRRREVYGVQSPESKRFRDSDCVYSPGSLRQRREMLRTHNCSDRYSSSSVLSSIRRNFSQSNKSPLAQAQYSPQHWSSAVAVRKATGVTPCLNIDQHSPAWREKYNRFVGAQGKSPFKADCQNGCSPSFSRRRLLYK
ncbi:hypothetical protein DPEC_G00340230 [Dallia pectoralis]|uniref:Uncharacterized protein n=1 Tax=Dallia pectoralis TaxID=75939 RepID=A0ACC2F546_DALPE|nr:hypothetical protein DPEC_G00340230 [Dallia pectoralis]